MRKSYVRGRLGLAYLRWPSPGRPALLLIGGGVGLLDRLGRAHQLAGYAYRGGGVVVAGLRTTGLMRDIFL